MHSVNFHFPLTRCEMPQWCSGLVGVRGVVFRSSQLSDRRSGLQSWQEGMWRISAWGLKGEQLGARQRARGSERLAAEAPVLSERLLCRAEQVSAEQLSPSLAADTLWIIVIYPQGLISVKVIALVAPLPFRPFFSTATSSFLPKLFHFLSSTALFIVVVL